MRTSTRNDPNDPDVTGPAPDADGGAAPRGTRATVGDLVARFTMDTADDVLTRRDRARDVGRLTRAVATSARSAGRASVLTGSWLVDLVHDIAPRIPIRDADTLRAQHPGITDEDLAQTLVSGAAKATAAVGAAGGALAAVEYLAAPSLVTVPAQIAAETLLVVAIEVKLIAELHELFDAPVPGTGVARTHAYLVAWSERRGFDPFSPTAMRMSLGEPAKRALRKRILRRAGRNLTTLGPMMGGAIAGSVVNHRETRRVGEGIRDDLRRRPPRIVPGETVTG